MEKKESLRPDQIFLSDLIAIPVEEIKPDCPMLTDCYIYLIENQKIIAIKSTLDFFTQEELKKYISLKSIYLHKDIVFTFPYRKVAHQIRFIMSQKQVILHKIFDPSSFVISHLVLEKMGSLWLKYPFLGPGVDPFNLVAFVQELFPEGVIGPEVRLLHEEDLFHRYFRSSLAVFLALHLGLGSLSYLESLRKRFFKLEAGNSLWERELESLVENSLKLSKEVITMQIFEKLSGDLIQKLSPRLRWIGSHLVDLDQIPPEPFLVRRSYAS